LRELKSTKKNSGTLLVEGGVEVLKTRPATFSKNNPTRQKESTRPGSNLTGPKTHSKLCLISVILSVT